MKGAIRLQRELDGNGGGLRSFAKRKTIGIGAEIGHVATGLTHEPDGWAGDGLIAGGANEKWGGGGRGGGGGG